MDGKKEIKRRETNAPERTRPGATYSPAVDIYELPDGIGLAVDLPGVSRENVDLKLEREVLEISARAEAADYQGARSLHREFDPAGQYYRAFTLGEEIDREKIEASLTNGVLRLKLPRVAAARSRRIKIKEN